MVQLRLPHEAPVGIVDPFVQLFLGKDHLTIPGPREAYRDDYSLQRWPSPDVVGYLFKKSFAETPEARAAFEEKNRIGSDIDLWIAQLDHYNIAMAGVGLSCDDPDELFDRIGERADRIFATVRVDPHAGMRGLRRITDLATRYPFIRSVQMSPFSIYPFIHLNSKEMYPVYAKCVELGLAAFVNVGFPGPRIPAWVQDPIHLDEVCWFFPELRVVMRHGGEPWEDVCVKMLLRWENLYYAPTAMAPRHYPQAIKDYLRTRGGDKIMFAGYWPALSYDRVFEELSDYDLKPDIWPRFLAGNARRAFDLDR